MGDLETWEGGHRGLRHHHHHRRFQKKSTSAEVFLMCRHGGVYVFSGLLKLVILNYLRVVVPKHDIFILEHCIFTFFLV